MNRPVGPTHLTRRRLAAFALALAVLLAAFYALPRGPGAGEEGADDRRLHEVAQHRRPGDVERREVGGLHAAAHQRPDGGSQAGPAPAEPRDERRRDRGGRHRRDVLARLQVDRLPGRPGRGAARARRPRRFRARLRPRGSATPPATPAARRRRPRLRAARRRRAQAGQAGPGRGGACASAAPRRAPQPRDRRGPVVAGHRDVRLLGDVHPPVPPAPRRRGAGGRGRARRRRTAGHAAGTGRRAGVGRGQRDEPPRAGPTPFCSTSARAATSCSAASATSRSTAPASCWPTPSTPP